MIRANCMRLFRRFVFVDSFFRSLCSNTEWNAFASFFSTTLQFENPLVFDFPLLFFFSYCLTWRNSWWLHLLGKKILLHVHLLNGHNDADIVNQCRATHSMPSKAMNAAKQTTRWLDENGIFLRSSLAQHGFPRFFLISFFFIFLFFLQFGCSKFDFESERNAIDYIKVARWQYTSWLINATAANAKHNIYNTFLIFPIAKTKQQKEKKNRFRTRECFYFGWVYNHSIQIHAQTHFSEQENCDFFPFSFGTFCRKAFRDALPRLQLPESVSAYNSIQTKRIKQRRKRGKKYEIIQ